MDKKYKLLIVEDSTVEREALKDVLSNEYDCTVCATGNSAIDKFKSLKPDIVLLDMMLPDMHGEEVLNKMKEIFPLSVIIVMTGYASIESAVSVTKKGAFDYICKPHETNKLEDTLRRAIKEREDREARNIKEMDRILGVREIICESDIMQKVLSKIRKVAESPSTTVLITGESGTGKGLFAKFIHYWGARKIYPFVEVNCAAIPENLLESELFGHEAGAFTDAKCSKKGMFELAHHGTIFLDEIGDMSLPLQSKILMALSERKICKVGGEKYIEVDVRLITATNQDLKNLVKEKRFREDLYYRISVVPVYIPPLRQREKDIILLANCFIKEFNEKFTNNVYGLSKEASEILISHKWPGNIRELRNVIERAVLFTKGNTITADDLDFWKGANNNEIPVKPPVVSPSTELRAGKKECINISIPLDEFSFEKFEKEVLENVLKITDWNQAKAAKILGIGRNALRNKIKKYKLFPPLYPEPIEGKKG